MRKYTRPEMECRVFAAESVLTASDQGQGGQGQSVSSMEALKGQLSSMDDVKNAPVVERDWTAMGN